MKEEARIEKCFQSNDIRCIYEKELDEDMIYKIGRAVVSHLKCKQIFVGRDMRHSSRPLFKALSKGVIEQGADVIDLGMVDTPFIYFASGFFKKPAAIITASHNSIKYNGVKLVKSGSEPIGEDTGLNKIKELVKKNIFPKIKKKGELIKENMSSQYRDYVLSFINKNELGRLKVVIDAGKGMAGKMIPIIYKGLPIKIIRQDFELEGENPNHAANPAIFKNLRKLRERVVEEKADLGMAFDSDMDRIFLIDEKGRILNSSVTGSLIIKNLLEKKGTSIIYSLICSKIVPETIKKLGGRALKTKVGHSYIKRKMRETNSLFAVEHSGHYYYSRNYYADSGIITSLIILEILSKNKLPLSELVAEFHKYSKMEETNFKVKDNQKFLRKIESHYRKKNPKKVEHSVGLTIEFENFWFNIRPSTTESLLRVNLEADDKETMNREMKYLRVLLKS